MTADSLPSSASAWSRPTKKGLVDWTLIHVTRAVRRAMAAERLAKADGLLQRLDARVKVVGLLFLVVTSALARNLTTLIALLAVGTLLGIRSHIRFKTFVRRLWFGVAFFTGPVALPAIFLTAGHVVYRLPFVDWPVTSQGLSSAAFLILRAQAATTFSLLLILCTPWTHVLKAFRVLRVPVVLVVLLGMTHRYIYVMFQLIDDMAEAKKSRTVGRLQAAEQRRWIFASIGVLLEKTFDLSNEVHLAMQARGFRGEVHSFDDFRMSRRDWLALPIFIAIGGAACWFGR